MKRLLRVLICFVGAFCLLWLIGYGNLMNDLEGSLPALIYIGSTVILSVMFFLIWELYLYSNNKINVLCSYIKDLEKEISELKKKE